MLVNQKKLSKLKISLFVALGVVIAFILAVFIYLKVNTYQPLEEASAFLSLTHVTETSDWIKVSPEKPEAQLVFYPGGLVEPVSYLPLLEPLREAGIEIFIIKMPLNLAILNSDAIEEVIKKEGRDVPLYLSGHSLGGASATLYLEEASEVVDGLLLLAAYPAKDNDLSDVNYPVVSITASNDDVLNWDTYEAHKVWLPKETSFISIEGGNHANFGSYGVQAGDGESEIEREKQQEKTRGIFIDLIGKRILEQ